MGDFYVYHENLKGAYFTAYTSAGPVVGVPEAGTLALLPLGLSILGIIRRKLKQQREIWSAGLQGVGAI